MAVCCTPYSSAQRRTAPFVQGIQRDIAPQKQLQRFDVPAEDGPVQASFERISIYFVHEKLNHRSAPVLTGPSESRAQLFRTDVSLACSSGIKALLHDIETSHTGRRFQVEFGSLGSQKLCCFSTTVLERCYN